MKKTLLKLIPLTVLPVLLAGASGPDGPRPESPTDRASYSLGHQIGTDLKRQGLTVDSTAIRQGLMDALAGEEPDLAPELMQEVLAGLKRRVKSAERERKRHLNKQHRKTAGEFLARNKSREGVVSLQSGLQYQVLRPGSGSSPGPDDKVAIHYRGTTLEGRVFHDSRIRPGKPEILHVSGVVRGLTEALQKMKTGGLWKLFLSPDLAYGRRGPLADHAVIFEVELISIVHSGEPGESP